MALEMVRVGKLGKEQSEDQLKLLRQIGQQVLQEATKQKAASISNPIQVLYDAREKRRKVVQKIRDDYEQMVKKKFQQFQRIRNKPVVYQGVSQDFTAFNQSFLAIQRR